MTTEGCQCNLVWLYLLVWHWSCPAQAERVNRAIWCYLSSIVKVPRLNLLELRSRYERA